MYCTSLAVRVRPSARHNTTSFAVSRYARALAATAGDEHVPRIGDAQRFVCRRSAHSGFRPSLCAAVAVAFSRFEGHRAMRHPGTDPFAGVDGRPVVSLSRGDRLKSFAVCASALRSLGRRPSGLQTSPLPPRRLFALCVACSTIWTLQRLPPLDPFSMPSSPTLPSDSATP
jgi:hypothetical protein